MRGAWLALQRLMGGRIPPEPPSFADERALFTDERRLPYRSEVESMAGKGAPIE